MGHPVPLNLLVFKSARSTFSILVCHVAISSLCSSVSGLFVSVDTIVLFFFYPVLASAHFGSVTSVGLILGFDPWVIYDCEFFFSFA